MIIPDSEKIFQNHMWLMATKTKVLTFHCLSFKWLRCMIMHKLRISMIYNYRWVVGQCQSWFLPKTERFKTCYVPYLKLYFNSLLFQVLCLRNQLLPDLWKICCGLPKFSVKFSVNFRKYFADFMKTFLFILKHFENDLLCQSYLSVLVNIILKDLMMLILLLS